MRERGSFLVDSEQQRMYVSRISAVSVVDKWAPYVVNFPRYSKWQQVI